MQNDHYRFVFENAPYAYALHEIMLDDDGKPCDYRFVEVNDAFNRITGLPSNVAGKTAMELLPGIRTGSFDWVEYYGKIALEGGHKAFEQYSEPLGKWYRVMVHSPKKHFFATIFTDITVEKDLQTYKNRLQLAQSFTAAGLWEYDINTGALHWSLECEKLFGLDEGVFEGTFRDFLKRVHPDDRNYVVEINKPVTELKEGVPLQYEHRIIRPDGEVRWVREAAGVMQDEAGKPAKIIGFVYDITEQKDKETALEQEEMLRQIVSNIDGAFWLMSADKQEMLYMSSNFERIFDRPRAGIVGNMEAYMELIHEEDREAGIKAYAEFLKTGNYAQEYRIRRPDGTIRWVHSTAFPVKNEQGNIIRFAGIIQDITEKKTSEIESKEKTERLNAILAAIPDMFFVVSKDGVFQDVIAPNPNKLIIPPEQVIGKTLHDIFSQEEAQKHLGYYEKCLREKKLTVFDYQIVLNDQTMFFEARLNPVDDNTVLSIVRDITESKRLQESYKQELEFRQFLFQNNKDGLVIVNNDHKVVDSNTAFCEMLGYSLNEIKALHTWDFDVLATEEDIRTGIDTTIDVDTTFESKHRRKDGTVYDVEISARSFNWEGERLVICTCRDITGRKRMQRETLEAKRLAEDNQRRFEEITEYTGEFFWEADKDGIFTYANSAVEKILGYKPEELVGKISGFDLLSEDYKTKIIEKASNILENKIPFHNLENVMISKSGKQVHLITNGFPVFNADGELIGYRGSDRDVTDQKIAEEKLKASEEKWRTLIEISPDGLAIIDIKGKIRFVNRQLVEMLGYDDESFFIGKDAFSFIDPSQHEKILQGIEDTINQVNPGAQTFQFIHKAGKAVYIDLNATMIKDAAGNPESIFVVHRDITEQKEVQEVIRKSEEKFRIVANNTYNWEFWESPEGTFIYHSPACKEITGYSPEALYKDTNLFLNLIHPDDRQGYLDHHKNAKQEHKKRTYYFRMSTPNGKLKHIEHLCRPVFDDNNNFLGVRGTNVDITERVEAKGKLMESKLFANAIIETTPALLYIYDLEKGVNVWANEYHKLFFEGISPESTKFKREDITQLTHPDDFEKLQSKVILLGSNPNMSKVETEIRIMYKGAWKWFSVLISIFKTNELGKPAQILGALIDIDDRKQVEEELKVAKEKAEEASRLKTAFIDNISHEIRTPLNGIIGFGQLVAQPNITSDERRDYFKTLQKSTDRLIQTVTDFMDISKIASGNMNVNAREFAIGNILNEQYERISGLCAAKGIDLRLDVPQEIGDLVIESDDELLRKALGHLLDNAVKFSEKGTITFGYKLNDQSVAFFVMDQGKGIAKEKLEKIFEPFIQEDLRMTRGYEGSGLGLAITQGIVKLLGGKVWARSEKAKGSEFFLSIPYEDKQETAVGVPSGTHKKQTIENPVILVAEDDESNFVLMEIILKKAGYEVLHAKNGQEAVDLCETNQDIHLVLMDIKMPVMNGLDATRHIKGFRADLPVVAVTAYLISGDEQLIKDAGCEEFCQKPFTRDSLLEMVGKYVGKRV